MRTVSSDHKIRYTVAALTLAALLPILFVPAGYTQWVAAAVLILAAVAACVLVKKRSILSFNKRQVLLLLTVVALVYLMLLYLTGLFFGFSRSMFTFEGLAAFRYILPVAAIIIATELARGVLLDGKSRGLSALIFVTCVVAEVFLSPVLGTVTSVYSFMDFVGMTLFPAITSNILFHYISKRYGMLPNIAYRLILTLYIYIIPYESSIPRIIPAFAGILLPLAAMLFIDVLFEKKKKQAAKKKSKWRFVAWGAILAVMASIIMLISCQFRFGMLVIATPSMAGELNIGDAVVFEAYRDQEIKEQDIIIFQRNNNGTNIIHRVVETERVGNETRYYTKGDANEDLDFGYVSESEIVGVVRFKIVYIGYPSLWLRGLFN